MMKFFELVNQVMALLQREGQVSYRALKLEFELNDETLEALKEEIIDIKGLATDKDGKMLVWTGNAAPASASSQSIPFLQSKPQTPASYTPPYLAQRIRAEQAAMEARGVADGERKTITALFADIKDSTALIEDLDPEEARRIIDPALKLM